MRGLRHHRDEGFSLIEVIVAIVIIGIVASSALWFFINGMQTSSNLQRQQAAVSIATSAMERSFTFDPRTGVATGVSGLVEGRSSSAVATAFSDLSGLGVDGVASTYPLSDTAGGVPALPISETVSRAKVDYTVYTLVGSCYRTATTSGADQDCEKVAGYSDEPAAVPVGKVRMLRVVVAVTWNSIGDECNGVCSYDVSTLVDPSLDLEWNRVIEPVAVEDTFSFAPGDPATTLDVLDNDVLGSVPSYPVSIVSGLPAGTGSLSTPSSDGTIVYTPPAAVKGTWVSGIFPFTYRVRDARGQTAQTTVSLYLQPQSADDSFDAYLGLSQVFDVTANDLGSPVEVTIVTPPVRGSIAVSGTQVTYTPTSKGPDRFTYTFSDASDLISGPAGVQITVQAVSAVDVTVPVTFRTNSDPGAGWQDVSAELRGSQDASARVIVTEKATPSSGSAAGAQLRVDGIVYTGGRVVGTTVEFQPPVTSAGEWTFPFALELRGYASDPAVAVMRVTPTPTANDDFVGELRRRGTRTIQAGLNDTPQTWGAGSGITVVLGDIRNWRCGSWDVSPSDLALGQLKIDLGNRTQDNCWAEYTLTGGGVSSTARIYYDVVGD